MLLGEIWIHNGLFKIQCPQSQQTMALCKCCWDLTSSVPCSHCLSTDCSTALDIDSLIYVQTAIDERQFMEQKTFELSRLSEQNCNDYESLEYMTVVPSSNRTGDRKRKRSAAETIENAGRFVLLYPEEFKHDVILDIQVILQKLRDRYIRIPREFDAVHRLKAKRFSHHHLQYFHFVVENLARLDILTEAQKFDLKHVAESMNVLLNAVDINQHGRSMHDLLSNRCNELSAYSLTSKFISTGTSQLRNDQEKLFNHANLMETVGRVGAQLTSNPVISPSMISSHHDDLKYLDSLKQELFHLLTRVHGFLLSKLLKKI